MCRPTDGRDHESEEGEEGENVDWRLFVGHIFKPNKSLQYIKTSLFFIRSWWSDIVCVCSFSAKGDFQRNGTSVVLQRTFVDTVIDPFL